jgi:hypothetical protein
VAFYTGTGDFVNAVPVSPTDTLTDGDNTPPGESTFESADTITDVSGDLLDPGTGGAFVGSFNQDVNGTPVTFVVIEDGISGDLYAAANIGALDPAEVTPGLPATLDTGTLDTDPFAVCFAGGTLIATPNGERAVETLAIGDPVLTADGRATEVKWIGRQTLHKLFTPADRFAPVRVTAEALDNGLPHTDLVLTAEHALILDGLAINAGALVNGTTIRIEPRDSLPDRVTYYHVETEGHEVILANGAPAETFVDYVTRRAFDNHAEFVARYGDERVIDEMPLPRISSPRLVPPSIRARLSKPQAA